MSQRRMFSPKIVGSDAFLEMPTSSRELYFQLGMYADDDGFVSPRKVMRMVGASDDDLKMLIAKRFVLPFDNGVVVVKHWRINNLIRKDFYRETQYLEQKGTLFLKENGSYSEHSEEGIPLEEGREQSVTKLLTQDRLGKDSIGKDSLERETRTPRDFSKSFFERGEYYATLLDEFSQNNDRAAVEREFQKFTLYWTEPNGSGTKLRWQQQSTFDVKRRLFTWLGRVKNYNSGVSKKYVAGMV